MRPRHYLLTGVCFVLGLLLAPLWHQPAGGQLPPLQGAPGKVGRYQVSASNTPGGLAAFLCNTETGQLWLYSGGQWQPMDSPVHKKK
jgi:hypothetical protein